MLTDLYIQNYALISKLELELGKGFYVLTGETGAGKSILIGALSLILGQRADVKSIKPGTEKCVVEATFDISAYSFSGFFEENDIDYYRQCSLRREVLASGKSRTFINDTPVSLSVLKDLAAQLIDIHSQHQNLLLSDSRFQLRALDDLSNHQPLLAEYSATFLTYRSIEDQLNELIVQAEKSKADEEYFRFQYNQLTEVKLSENEQVELEEEFNMLTHAEEIKSGMCKIGETLSGDGFSILQLLKETTQTAIALAKIYPSSEEIAARIETCYIELKDLAAEACAKAESVDFDPERLQQINDRLNQIYSLQQRHRVQTVAELLAIEHNLKERIYSVEHLDEQIEILRKRSENQLALLRASGEKISENRKKSAQLLEKNLEEQLAYLGMPTIRFTVDFERKNMPGANGLDEIKFLFSANKNMPLQPVAETASGGEISRLMLCIKALIANTTALPTII
ncbi:MAG: AAA family ATPase, partial [Bacteroidales bacterium]|nr:AAA family ATPase [Bacteroidales bacterium]